ncbi:MAG: hypothetical protein QXG32_05755 [Candidatus Bathyarchaeia archaeon]
MVAKGDKFKCEICGIVCTIDEICGCSECDLICCGKPMKRVSKK